MDSGSSETLECSEKNNFELSRVHVGDFGFNFRVSVFKLFYYALRLKPSMMCTMGTTLWLWYVWLKKWFSIWKPRHTRKWVLQMCCEYFLTFLPHKFYLKSSNFNPFRHVWLVLWMTPQSATSHKRVSDYWIKIWIVISTARRNYLFGFSEAFWFDGPHWLNLN